MNIAIQPYQERSVLSKDAIKQPRSKNGSLYLVQRNILDERLQSSLKTARNNVNFDLSQHIVEKSNLRNDVLENLREISIRKYEQAQVTYKVYRNTTTFSATI